MKGLEPPRLAAPDPKSGAAAITPHPRIWTPKIQSFCLIPKFIRKSVKKRPFEGALSKNVFLINYYIL